MRAVVVEKQRGRSKSVKARRAYVCFLEREVYAFCGERVRGAMLRARIFCLWEGRRERCERRAVDRPQMDRRRHVRRACEQSSAGGTTRERCAEKGKKKVFLFLEERSGDAFFLFWVATTAAGAQLSRPWGVGAAAKMVRARVAIYGGTQLVAACGLRPPDPAYPAYIP